MSGLDAVREEFAERDADPRFRSRHGEDDVAHRRALEGRSQAVAEALRSLGVPTLDGLRVLDVGCGRGRSLQTLPGAGAARCVGVDVNEERLGEADGGAFTLADARRLPFGDGTFDLALLFTTLSSMEPGADRVATCQEVLRVVRPGGAVLVYDFRRFAGTRAARGLESGEVARLFAPHAVDSVRTTLAPPLARTLPAAAPLLEKLPFLRTHDLHRVRRGGAG